MSMLSGLRRPSSERLAFQAARSAAFKGNPEQLQSLLADNPQLLSEVDSRQENLLGVAARAGREESVQALISYASCRPGGVGAIVNKRNADGDTPLTLAIAGGHLGVAASLLKYDETDLGVTNKKGNTALHIAVARNDLELIALLVHHATFGIVNINNANGETPLEMAIESHRAGVVKLLLKHPDTDVNLMIDEWQRTLLYRAVEENDKPTAGLLLADHRIHPFLRATDGLTPLHLAVRNNDAEWVKLLASHPTAGVHLDDGGHGPLSMAVDSDCHAAIEALLESEHVDPNAQGPDGLPAVWRVLDRLEESSGVKRFGAMSDLLRTLSLLTGSQRVDINWTLDGETPLTFLCGLSLPAPRTRFRKTLKAAVSAILQADHLDPNIPNHHAEHPLALALDAKNYALLPLLVRDNRTDACVLAPWLFHHPQEAFRVFNKQRNHDHSPSDDELDRFMTTMLTDWADRRKPDGAVHIATGTANFHLGLKLGAQEEKAAAGGKASQACSKDAVFRLALSIEQWLDDPHDFVDLQERSQALLKYAPPDMRHFNLQGVDVSRNDIETWAAGKLPDGFGYRQIDAAAMQGQINVHDVGLTVRGSQIMTDIQDRLKPEQMLSRNASIKGMVAAINAARLDADDDSEIVDPPRGQKTPQPKTPEARGLKFALTQDERVKEGLNINVSGALSLMWSHIQASESPLKENLTESLLRVLMDIEKDRPCNTGCVQRILYAVDGVDLSLMRAEPDGQTIRSEIEGIAGDLNNRFEQIYGHGAADPDGESHRPSTSTENPLTAEERAVVALYQSGQDIDDTIVVEIKQDMLDAAVRAELLDKRGWQESAVKPELETVKEWMKYV